MTDKPSNIAIAQTLFNADPAVNDLGLELVASEPGAVTIALVVEDRHLNFNGTCHGGVILDRKSVV